MKLGPQTLTMFDQDQDKTVDKAGSNIKGWILAWNNQDDRSKDVDQEIFNLDQAIGDIMLNSKVFNTISITNLYRYS